MYIKRAKSGREHERDSHQEGARANAGEQEGERWQGEKDGKREKDGKSERTRERKRPIYIDKERARVRGVGLTCTVLSQSMHASVMLTP